MNRPRRKSPPVSDDRRARRDFDAPGDDDQSDADDTRRASRRPPETDRDGYDCHKPLCKWCLEHADLLTGWEENFCVSITSFAELSDKQWQTLRGIADKVELGIGVLRKRRNRR